MIFLPATTGSLPSLPQRVTPISNKELLKGYKTPSITYKVHLDSYNQLDFLQGKGEDQRKGILLLER